VTELFRRIIDRFPSPTPRDLLESTQTETFDVRTTASGDIARTVYRLDKAPVLSLTRVVVGRRTLTPPDGVELRDIDGDGRPDAVAFTDASVYPAADQTFDVVYQSLPLIHRFTRASTTDIHAYGDRVDAAIADARIETATGQYLDELGSLYGRLGRRRGRRDETYRTHIRTLRTAFKGRGTRPGLRDTVAEALQTDPENVTIIEDFEQVGYSIRVTSPSTSLLTGSLSELLELADPSGVELLAEPVITLQGAVATCDSDGFTVTAVDADGLGAGTIGGDTL
jgi:hypothetical protein